MNDSVKRVCLYPEEWWPVYEYYHEGESSLPSGTMVAVPERTLERWKHVTNLFTKVQEEMRQVYFDATGQVL